MKKILFTLLLSLFFYRTYSQVFYSPNDMWESIGSRGDLDDLDSNGMEAGGETLPSWTGNYNIIIPEGDSYSITGNYDHMYFDTLILGGELRQSAYNSHLHIKTLIVTGTGHFNGSYHTNGNLRLYVDNLILENGATFDEPSTGPWDFGEMTHNGNLYVGTSVTYNQHGSDTDLISYSDIQSLPGSFPKYLVSGNVDGEIPSAVHTIILQDDAVINAPLDGTDGTFRIRTLGHNLTINSKMSNDIRLFGHSNSTSNPSTIITLGNKASGILRMSNNNRRFKGLVINTNSIVTLGSRFDIYNNSYNLSALTLTKGVLYTTSSNLLYLDKESFITGASYDWASHQSGGSDSSYIDGPISKVIHNNSATRTALGITDGDFYIMFPTGKNGTLREAGVENPTNNSTTFTVQYFDMAHHDFMNLDPLAPSDEVSPYEYWDVDRTSGSANAEVILSYNSDSGIGSSNLPSSEVLHYNGTKWESQGQQTYSSHQSMGSLRSSSAMSFSPFTLGGSGFMSLPVELVSFKGKVVTENNILLYWTTASEYNNSHFEIEASYDGKQFDLIGMIEGAGNSQTAIDYQYLVNASERNYKFYRLKQVDFDGEYSYSNILSISNSKETSLHLTLYPNPISGDAINTFFTLQGEDQIRNLRIIDSQGRVIKEITKENDISLYTHIDIHSLHNGIYYLNINTYAGLHETQRFIVKDHI